jgi:hypothetical protein
MDRSNRFTIKDVPRIEFNCLPLGEVDEADRESVGNLAKIMLTIKYPISSNKWYVVKEEGSYVVICEYPRKIKFELGELSTIQSISYTNVDGISISVDEDCTKLCATYHPMSNSRPITITWIKTMQEHSKDPTKKTIVTDSEEPGMFSSLFNRIKRKRTS